MFLKKKKIHQALLQRKLLAKQRIAKLFKLGQYLAVFSKFNFNCGQRPLYSTKLKHPKQFLVGLGLQVLPLK